MIRRLSLPVDSEDELERLAASARPLRARRRSAFQLLRETFFDTPDGTLRDHRTSLRLRAEAAGRQSVVLTVTDRVNLLGVLEETVLETPVVDGGFYATLAGSSELATTVRELADPAGLRPALAVDIDREARDLAQRWFGRATLRVHLDVVIAHTAQATRAFQEISVAELSAGNGDLERIAERLLESQRLEGDGLALEERALRALVPEGSPARVEVPHDVAVALLMMFGGEVALAEHPDGLGLPTTRGSGEELAQEYLSELVPDAEGGELELVGFAPARRRGSDLEVWLFEAAADIGRPEGLVWIPLGELLERVGGPRLRGAGLVATLQLLVRSEVGVRLLREPAAARAAPRPIPLLHRDTQAPAGSRPDDYLDLDLSILDFNQRVLELAEDDGVPLLERFRFLSIFSSNLDEFFVVRAGRLKEEAARADGEGSAAAELLELIGIRVRALVARQYACLARDLLPGLATHGIRLRRWQGLSQDERRALVERFEKDIFPLLTPLALSAAPGRAFPRLVSLGLCVAAVLAKEGDAQIRFGSVSISGDLPRFLPIPGGRDVIAVEELVQANAAQLFPGSAVQEVHVFRVSRTGDVEIDEDSTGSLLAAVADEVEARPYKPVVRLEVQRSMPREVQSYLVRELRAERGTDTFELGRGDVFEVEGPIDLRGFAELALLDLPGETFAPFEPHGPLADDVSIFQRLHRGDVLVHHPFDDFESTVGRFLDEAADDSDVVAIKLTLYRTGKKSPVVQSLLRAVAGGKDVSVFVELKARFDEESNIEWTHRLTEAGAHVVYGLVGYKTHAKVALVVRREPGGVRRYAHVGTGNYNAATARFYTDLGLMTADPDIGADLNDFFNELTGSSGPPEKACRKLLVAPSSLAPALIELIEREAGHARAGRPARIRAKLNGLADQEIVRALYEASAAGVDVELLVRSICTLRPGVPGLSERIRVLSILGRFLEHSRVYAFENAGEPAYYLGSADWRARNLRRRVEVVTPIEDAGARARLDRVLTAGLDDPRAWVLRSDGVYERRRSGGPTSQERFMSEARDAAR